MRISSTREARSARVASAVPVALACALLCPAVAGAHAIAGDRVFPATMAVDDPGVSDEINLEYGHIKSPNDNGDDININTVSFEWDKLITSNLAFSIGSAYINRNGPDGSPKASTISKSG